MNFLNEYLLNQNCVICFTDSFSYTLFSLTLLLKKIYLIEASVAPGGTCLNKNLLKKFLLGQQRLQLSKFSSKAMSKRIKYKKKNQ